MALMPLVPAHVRHQWHMRFDSVCCRNCGVTGDDGKACRGARKVRPMATGVPQRIRHQVVKTADARSTDSWQ